MGDGQILGKSIKKSCVNSSQNLKLSQSFPVFSLGGFKYRSAVKYHMTQKNTRPVYDNSSANEKVSLDHMVRSQELGAGRQQRRLATKK